MTNNKKLVNVFIDALAVEAEVVTDNLQYNSIAEWDSVAHMALIAQLEEVFDVMLDTDDIIDMSSPLKAKTILTKYGVSF